MKQESIKEEEHLQEIVEEVMVDIENDDFDEAYIKANTIHYTSGWSSDIEEKWYVFYAKISFAASSLGINRETTSLHFRIAFVIKFAFLLHIKLYLLIKTRKKHLQ